MEERRVTIALAGNPNCGKTTIFNTLTGANQSIGNWPGVTVEKLEGQYQYQSRHHDNPGVDGHEPHYHTGTTRVKVVDLPGIYALSANSEDERAARDYLLGGEADLVVNILDSTNLERNLYLTVQLLEMGVPVLVVLNMADLAERRNINIDKEHLQAHLGVPVLGVSALKKGDIDRLKEAVNQYSANPARVPLKVAYPNEVEELIARWEPAMISGAAATGTTSRWFTLALLTEDETALKDVAGKKQVDPGELSDGVSRVQSLLGESIDVIVADYRYGVAKSMAKEVVSVVRSRQSLTDQVDRVVMNRFLGVPIFLAVMYLVFWVTINLGTAFADFFDIFIGLFAVDGTAALLESLNAPEWLIFLISGGLGSGIQAVATFVPFIFFMFFMLSLLEDSGYMARAAFVMDRFMGLIGLPGKAFVPMLVGFGCTVPAILATRTLDTRRDRLMTIFMVPLMSCGARLPVYALFSAAFFGTRSGAVVFSLYLAGIILAVLTGFLVRDSLFAGESSHLIMELPHYHAPRMRHILLHTWSRLKDFIIRAGKVIILATLILGFFSSLGVDGSFGNEDNDRSLLAVTGRTITPVFTPMGIENENWPATVGLFTGVFAKEAIVGTLSALYGQSAAAEEDAAPEAFSLTGGLKAAFASIPEGLIAAFGGSSADDVDSGLFQVLRRRFTPASAYAYLLFVLIYLPCLAAVAAAWREMGPLLGLTQSLYLTVLAWSIATLFYQTAEGHSTIWIVVSLGILAAIVITSRIVGRRRRPDPQ
jgi:ferrous iron transport protein B